LLLVVLGRVARRAIQTPLERGSSRTSKDHLEPGMLS
jgi:hypothetical protein